mmetsp:Transcript_31652/g.47183  ORF Transcript_31652/g.47183 Transcript_31652/m.47183 type:complete len:81 (-) Transcript_31652:8-250(-)
MIGVSVAIDRTSRRVNCLLFCGDDDGCCDDHAVTRGLLLLFVREEIARMVAVKKSEVFAIVETDDNGPCSTQQPNRTVIW